MCFFIPFSNFNDEFNFIVAPYLYIVNSDTLNLAFIDFRDSLIFKKNTLRVVTTGIICSTLTSSW